MNAHSHMDDDKEKIKVKNFKIYVIHANNKHISYPQNNVLREWLKFAYAMNHEPRDRQNEN